MVIDISGLQGILQAWWLKRHYLIRDMRRRVYIVEFKVWLWWWHVDCIYIARSLHSDRKTKLYFYNIPENFFFPR